MIACMCTHVYFLYDVLCAGGTLESGRCVYVYFDLCNLKLLTIMGKVVHLIANIFDFIC